MDADAVVVGAGPNGLVAANRARRRGLVGAGARGAAGVGGAVRSARDVHPDFVHDTFSSFYPLAAASPRSASLGLEEHGLRWRHAPAVLGHPLPRRRAGRCCTATGRVTAAGLDAHAPGRRRRLARLCELWDRVGDAARRRAADAVPAGPARCAGGWRGCPGRRAATSCATLLTPAADAGPHASSAGDRAAAAAGRQRRARRHPARTRPAPGSIGLLMTMLGQTVGFPVPGAAPAR